MAKQQVNVNLAFTADTAQAKAQIQELSRSLDMLSKGTAAGMPSLKVTDELMQAQNAAGQLKVALDAATNVNTGKLDLTKFSTSLKRSGMGIQKIQEQLFQLGPSGQTAFLQLSQSIMNAEVPLRRTNALLQEFATSLANTARWQISSSILHGFMGAIQSAFGYAKDLNESLNNIRIVTGKSVDDMSDFADEANRAAKALSTTTTAYTDAALIYYQQGLSDDAVKERTDVTIKMANVARESATDISSYMTAIWNNFNKEGTESAEHYADVMTKLGATTASSTAEIAEGLEKFSAVADTIGLSFDYAASALSTIVATTRQSQDTVGTALKTIFARLESLKLGDTLDDGTSLTKYTQALDTVGVAIFDSNNKLKDMDDILDDLGEKWQGLEKNERVALAQTVAGTRQYTQLVALMDNWGVMKQNLATAASSDGELERQAEIYAESWDAASKRVKAAAETIYSDLLDDKFFIKLTDGLADVLEGIDKIIKSAGGLKGVLAGVSSILLKTFNTQIAGALNSIAYSFNSMTGKNLKQAENTKNEMYQQALEMPINSSKLEEDRAIAETMQYQIKLQKEFQEAVKRGNLCEEDQKRYQILLDINKAYGEQAIKAAQARDAASSEKTEATKQGVALIKSDEGTRADFAYFAQQQEQARSILETGRSAQQSLSSLNSDLHKTDPSAFNSQIKQLTEQLKRLGQTDAKKSIEALKNKLNTGKISAKEFVNEVKKIVSAEDLANAATEKAIATIEKALPPGKESTKVAQTVVAAEEKIIDSSQQLDGAFDNLKRHAADVSEILKNAGNTVRTYANVIVTAAQGVNSITMGIQSLKSAVDSIKDSDTSGWEKLGSVLLSLGMGFPMIISGLQAIWPASLIAAAGFEKDVAGATLLSTTFKKGTVTGISFAAALWSIVWPLLVIAATIGAGVLLYRHFTKASRTAEKTADAANDAAEAYNNVKTEAENLSSTLDTLAEKTNAIKDLTYGTSEWASAVMDVNSEMTDLITKYGLIQGKDWTFNSEGVMVLSDAGRENTANQVNTRAKTANAINVAGNFATTSTSIAGSIEKLGNKYMGLAGEDISIDEIKQGFSAIVEALEKGDISQGQLSSYSALSKISPDVAELVSSNKSLQKSLEDLALETMKNTEAYQLRLITQVATDEEFQDYFKDENPEYKQAIYGQIASDIANIVEATKDSVTQDEINENKDAYAESLGYTKKGGEWYNGDEKINFNDKGIQEMLKAWITQNKAIEETKGRLESYNELIDNSKKTWAKAEKIAQGSWKTIRENIGKTSSTLAQFIDENGQAFEEFQTELGDLLNLGESVSKKILTSEFVTKNADLIEDALNQDGDALTKLSDLVADEYVVNVGVTFDNVQADDEVNTLMAQLDSNIDDLHIGATLDDGPIRDTLNALVETGKVDANKLMDYLSLKGFTGVSLIPQYRKVRVRMAPKWAVDYEKHNGQDGYIWDSQFTGYTVGGGTYNGQVAITPAKIDDTSGDGGTGTGSPSGGGGGGSSEKQKDLTDDKTDRYYSLNKAIATTADTVKLLNDEEAKLFGHARLAAMEKEVEILDKQIDRYRDKLSAVLVFMEQDRASLNSYGYTNASSFTGTGDFKSGVYEAIAKQALKELNDVETAYNNMSAAEQKNYEETLKAAQLKYKNFKEALDLYVSDLDLLHELEESILDTENQILEKNYAIIKSALELKVKVADNAIAEIDTAVKLLNDDVYRMAEGFALVNDKIDPTLDKAKMYQDTMDQLTEAYENGEISQASYRDGMQEIHDQALKSIDDILSLDKTMREYYGNTLSKAIEELKKYTSRFETLNSVLEHYQKLLEVTGQQTNYKKLGVVYDGIAKNAKNSLDVSTSAYKMLQAEMENERQRLMSSTGMTTDQILSYTGEDTTLQEWKKRWQNLQETAATYQENMLSDAEEYAEALTNVLTNTLNDAAAAMEDLITQGNGFETLNDSLSRVSQNANEYLTRTNQIYESNKLLRTISQDIDKTTNQAAKQRLSAFANEIEQLKEKDELSNLELQIAQAKYKQLQAQIALEEAQKEKSTVRLSRDSEGNYGYVYSADSDKISSSEQALEDATNSLYNIELKAANDYSQKALQAQQALAEKLVAIDKNRQEGMFASEEEYQAERARVISEYTTLITTYSNMYAIATTDDANVITDAWSTAYANIIMQGGNWEEAITNYVAQVDGAWCDWQDSMDVVTNIVGSDLDTLETNVKEVTYESEKLARITMSTVIPALGNEIKTVGELTQKYLAQRDAILETIAALQALAALSGEQASTSSSSDYIDGVDYAAMMAQYMSVEGHSMNDAEFKEMARQRQQKIIANNLKDSVESNEMIIGQINNDTWRQNNNHKYSESDYEKNLEKILNHTTAIEAFATGGYTGEWGPSGKLAILDQKELVLNENDTSNFLASMKILKDISSMIDLSAGFGLNTLSAFGIKTLGNTIEQQVSITAEFPNATDHNEIEEAFNSLINRAAQYASRA